MTSCVCASWQRQTNHEWNSLSVIFIMELYQCYRLVVAALVYCECALSMFFSFSFFFVHDVFGYLCRVVFFFFCIWDWFCMNFSYVLLSVVSSCTVKRARIPLDQFWSALCSSSGRGAARQRGGAPAADGGSAGGEKPGTAQGERLKFVSWIRISASTRFSCREQEWHPVCNQGMILYQHDCASA